MSPNQVPHQGRFEPRSRRPLVRLWRTFLTGLVPIVPVTVTGYVVYWVFTGADSLFRGIGQALLPPGWYFPGLGLVLAVLAVLALGAILNASDYGRLALRLGNRLLERIPLVKTVYGGVRDLMLFVARPPDAGTRHVVLVTLPGDIRLIGFITDTAPAEAVPELSLEHCETVLAVYLPMSYQIGGYTLYFPERCVQRLEMSVEAGADGQPVRAIAGHLVHRPEASQGPLWEPPTRASDRIAAAVAAMVGSRQPLRSGLVQSSHTPLPALQIAQHPVIRHGRHSS